MVHAGDIFRSKNADWSSSGERALRPSVAAAVNLLHRDPRQALRACDECGYSSGRRRQSPAPLSFRDNKGAPTARLQRVEVNFKGSYRAGSPPGSRRARHVARRPTSAVPALARPLPVSSSLRYKFLKQQSRAILPYRTALTCMLYCVVRTSTTCETKTRPHPLRKRLGRLCLIRFILILSNSVRASDSGFMVRRAASGLHGRAWSC